MSTPSISKQTVLLAVWLMALSFGSWAEAPRFLTGADVSYWQEFEKKGAVYQQDGKAADLLGIFKNAGCNTIRLRLWTRDPARPEPPPLSQLNDLEYVLGQAKRVKAAGLKILLCMHYSDTWADPGKQVKPAAWRDLDFEGLKARVRGYTREVIAEMKRQGVMPEVVQIGNEITNGMLWPEGKTGKDPAQNAKFAELIKAGIAGAREGAGGGPAPRIMIHIDGGQNWDRVRWFFDMLAAQGVTDFDMIGLSFYPYWGGTMPGLKKTLAGAAEKYKKDIVVVETAYPWAQMDFKNKPQGGEKPSYPMTSEGQRQFTQELIEAVRATPGGHGAGVIWWGADYLDPEKYGRPSAGWLFRMALFDGEGNALPALKELGKAGK